MVWDKYIDFFLKLIYFLLQRISLQVTRKILDAIHEGKLDNVPTKKSTNFGLNIPEFVPQVDGRILDPENMWQEKVFLKKIKIPISF